MAALTPEQVQEYLKQMAEASAKLNSGGAKLTKIPDGASRIRILPNWASKSPMDPNSVVRFGRHWVKGVSNDHEGKNLRATTLCYKSTYGKSCPVCDAYWSVKNLPNLSKELETLVRESNAGTRYIVNALIRTSAEPNKVVQLDLPYGVYQDIYGDGQGKQGVLLQWMLFTGNRAFPLALEDGTDIIIRKTGSKFSTKYAVEMIPPTEVSPSVDPSVLSQLVDLNALVAQWQHTPEEEAEAIKALQEIAAVALSGAHSNNPLLHGQQPYGGPVFAPPAQPIFAPPPQPAFQVPAGFQVPNAAPVAPIPAQVTQPATPTQTYQAAPTVDPATGADVTGDVFPAQAPAAPAPGSVQLASMSVEEITKLLQQAGMTPEMSQAVQASI